MMDISIAIEDNSNPGQNGELLFNEGDLFVILAVKDKSNYFAKSYGKKEEEMGIIPSTKVIVINKAYVIEFVNKTKALNVNKIFVSLGKSGD